MLSQLFVVELEIGGMIANVSNIVTYQQEALTVEFIDVPVDTVRSDNYMIYVSNLHTSSRYNTSLSHTGVATGLQDTGWYHPSSLWSGESERNRVYRGWRHHRDHCPDRSPRPDPHLHPLLSAQERGQGTG